jgi:hypothetical protein
MKTNNREKQTKAEETLKKFFKGISLLMMFIGFMFAVATAGASDCDTITIGQVIYRLIISLAVISAGFGLYSITE